MKFSWGILLLLFFVFSFLFKTDSSFDQDLGRHIKLGEIIVKTQQVPKTNLFSYTNPDFPFVNTHWLFEVLVYLVNQTIGLQWLLVLKIAVILLSIWLVIKTIPKQNQALFLPIGFIFLHVLRERIELRPEIFSFLFTALTLYILEQFRQMSSDRGTNAPNPKLIFLLPLIQLVWINTHIYFFVGFILQVIFLIYISYQKLRFHLGGGRLKLLLIVFILSVLVSLINPNGLSGILYPLNVTKNYGYSIVENQTMFLLESINFRDPNFLFVKLSAGLVGLSLAVAFFRRQWKVKDVLLAVTGLVLALMHVRSFPYLVLLSLPATVQNFGPIKGNKSFTFLLLVTCALLLLESFFYLNGDYYRNRDDQHKVGLGFEENVKGAMDFVLANNLPGPVYNNFDIGSYVLYRGYPKYQVFADGRPEAYPAAFFHQIYIPGQSDYAKFKEQEKTWQFKTVIFSHTDQTPWGRNFLQNVVKDPEWRTVYIDDFTIVLVSLARSDLANVKVLDLAQLNPNSYKFDSHVANLKMGIFLLSTGYTDSGRQFIQKTLQIFPDSPIANSIIGNPQKSKFFW